MADCKSVASKLFSKLRVCDYRDYCTCIVECDVVRMCDYHKLPISNTHYIDLRYCFVENVFNPSHVLDYFAQYSGLDCNELCMQALDLVKADREHWVHMASVVLPLRPQNFDEWLTAMSNNATACDEFFFFALSQLHYRHTIVYTMKRSWTTLCAPGTMSDEELHAVCDLHLIYLGQDVYGLLQPTMSLPPQVNPCSIVHDVMTSNCDSNDSGYNIEQSPSLDNLKPQVKSLKMLLVEYLKTSDSSQFYPVISDTPICNDYDTSEPATDDERLKQTSDTINKLGNSSIIPPPTALVLPLKLLTVEYLKTCDSPLVNPVVYVPNTGTGTLSGNGDDIPVASINHTESTSSSDEKSSNTENVPIYYNKYLL